jgi:hypothetical protein
MVPVAYYIKVLIMTHAMILKKCDLVTLKLKCKSNKIKQLLLSNVTINFLKFRLLPFQETIDLILNLIHHL